MGTTKILEEKSARTHFATQQYELNFKTGFYGNEVQC